MADHCELSVVICSLGRIQSLDACLKSLSKQSFQNFEVVLVSDRRPMNPYGLKLIWLQDPNQGLAKARDVGWRHSQTSLIAWIDDDVIVDRNWAQAVVQTFKDPSIGGVSGPTVIPESLLSNRRVFWWHGKNNVLSKLWVSWVLDGDPYQVGRITRFGWWSPGSNFSSCLKLRHPVEVDYLEACNMTLRRDLVETAGGFDVGFKGTSEWCEVDLVIRVKRLGYRLVFDPQVKVEHHVSKAGVYRQRFNYGERLSNYFRFRSHHLRFNL